MKSNFIFSKLFNFRLRKIVHYSLILSILLIQLIIAGFFYNEFVNRKNLGFIDKQLNEIKSVENITQASREKLLNAQADLQKYILTNDDKFLQAYFKNINSLNENFENLKKFKTSNPNIEIILNKNEESEKIKNLKTLIDSSYSYSTKTNLKLQRDLPQLKKFNLNYNLNNIVINKKTYTDSTAKKGLFGRLKDAISGNENIRKDSTVVLVKQGENPESLQLKNKVDSLINIVNNHYFIEVKKIKLNDKKNQNTDKENQNTKNGFYKLYDNILVYSNDILKVYEDAFKNSKLQLEKEYEKQNLDSSKIRNYLILGLMVLMFFVSILIMYFTRMAFVYENKLKIANKEIKENLNFKNRILGMLSHELRSPLKIIGIFINRINKKTEDEKIKEYLKSISFTNDTLLIQANQILEYTKNQQVKNKIIPVIFNLKNEINSILTAIEPYIETRNNKLIITENIDPKLIVFSDNTKINQIFMNILGNANKFTENGKIFVDVKTEVINENKISLITKIQDTGVGISKSDLEKIFEPYYQGIISNEIENLGAGLGLSLCREIIKLYPGEISVDSEQNKGTIVNFNLELQLK